LGFVVDAFLVVGLIVEVLFAVTVDIVTFCEDTISVARQRRTQTKNSGSWPRERYHKRITLIHIAQLGKALLSEYLPLPEHQPKRYDLVP
jgi:hypothetical protein